MWKSIPDPFTVNSKHANSHQWEWTGSITWREWVCRDCRLIVQHTMFPQCVETLDCLEYKVSRVHHE